MFMLPTALVLLACWGIICDSSRLYDFEDLDRFAPNNPVWGPIQFKNVALPQETRLLHRSQPVVGSGGIANLTIPRLKGGGKDGGPLSTFFEGWLMPTDQNYNEATEITVTSVVQASIFGLDQEAIPASVKVRSSRPQDDPRLGFCMIALVGDGGAFGDEKVGFSVNGIAFSKDSIWAVHELWTYRKLFIGKEGKWREFF